MAEKFDRRGAAQAIQVFLRPFHVLQNILDQSGDAEEQLSKIRSERDKEQKAFDKFKSENDEEREKIKLERDRDKVGLSKAKERIAREIKELEDSLGSEREKLTIEVRGLREDVAKLKRDRQAEINLIQQQTHQKLLERDKVLSQKKKEEDEANSRLKGILDHVKKVQGKVAEIG